MKKIAIYYQNKKWEYPVGTPLLQVTKEIASEPADQGDVLLARIGGRLYELPSPLEESMDGQELHFITSLQKDGRRAYRRSVLFMMQKALDQICPGEDLDISVHHSPDHGYVCRIVRTGQETDADHEMEYPDSLWKGTVTEEFLEALKKQMMHLVEQDLPFQKKTIRTRDAERLFHERHLIDKEKLLHYRVASHINVYDLDGYIDYYYGYMVPSTGYLGVFELQKFDDGFVLRVPYKDAKAAAPFSPSAKYYAVLKESEQWGESMGIPTVGALNDMIAKGNTRDLILMQEAFMEQKIGTLAEQIVSEGNKKFIMIAGPSSSGKTTFSYRLSAQLRARGVHPYPIALDDYYLDRDVIPLDEYGEKDFESITALDIQQFNRDMVALLAGDTIELPSFNFKTGKREYRGRQLSLGEKDVLVIEGIHGLNDLMSAAIAPEYKFKIYISALTQLRVDECNPLSTTDGRLIRRIVRDSRTRGTSAKDTIAMWDSVRRGEEKNIFPFQEQADVIFNSALIYEMAVLKLYAQPQLLAIDRDCPEYVEAKRLLKLLDYFLPMSPEDICNNSILREFIGGSCLPV